MTAMRSAGAIPAIPDLPSHHACALPEMAITPPPFPDTEKEEKATPRPTEAAVEGGQVRFVDEIPIESSSARYS